MNSVPYNNEAEQSLIGSVFLDNRVLLDTIDKIYPEDFYQMRHQILYRTLLELHEEGKPIDITTVTTKLKDKNQFIEVGGLEYLIELSEMVPTTANIDTYVEIVR